MEAMALLLIQALSVVLSAIMFATGCLAFGLFLVVCLCDWVASALERGGR